jgi:hypothetical protein
MSNRIEGEYSTNIFGQHSGGTVLSFSNGKVVLRTGSNNEQSPVGMYYRTNSHWVWQSRDTRWQLEPRLWGAQLFEIDNPTNTFFLKRKWLPFQKRFASDD